jgi:hypothetical protein
MALPSLGALKPDALQPVDAPSMFRPRAKAPQPWRIAIEQYIKDKGDRLVYRVDIKISGGVLSEHRAVVVLLDKIFDPVFDAAGFKEHTRSGVALHKCSMPSASTIEWAYERTWDGPMPPGGVPPGNDLPGGSGYEFLKMTLGRSPVELNGSVYEWTIAPGIPDMVRRSEWILTRIGAARNEGASMMDRLRRAARR